jgi:transcriptional regulator with XRE-family HTH domain
MKGKRMNLTDQIRAAVDASGLSRYRICKTAGIDQAVMSRFMAGTRGMTLPTLNKLADVLALDVTARNCRPRLSPQGGRSWASQK